MSENITFSQGLKIAVRSLSHIAKQWPLCVSFEVTNSCNADCLHCDKGGIVKENTLTPREYRELAAKLHPPFAQISGGEPLLRKDIIDVARAIKQADGLPYLIFVTNGYLLTKERYLALREAGVNQFSVSLDFPDSRHDSFRKLPGLYGRLSETIPEIARLGHGDLVLNTAITKGNLPHLLDIVKRAEEWGVGISFSAYSILRTGSRDHTIERPDELNLLDRQIGTLIRWKKEGRNIRNPVSILRKTLRFFKEGEVPCCRSGIRFLLVTPEGHFRPCAHQRSRNFVSQEELVREFSSKNQCGGCYVAIRSYADKSLPELVRDYLFSH
ncbi:MAG: radical SAM protein [Candidatus Omnitrophica bacterium]|nr:radical SAM protein [Candidatus Omnitrophota bacterium]